MMIWKAMKYGVVGLLLVLLATAEGFAVDVDSKLADYKAVSGVSGKIKSIGSDTLNNLMALWSEGYRSKYPGVQIEIEGKGSTTAPPA